MTDGLLSWCLGFCRLQASWLTEAVKRCSTYYRLLLKSPGISKVLLHCHAVEPVQNAVISNISGHLHRSCIGFMIMVHVLWQISYHSTTKQWQLLEFNSESGWISFLFSSGIPWIVCGLGVACTKLSLALDITIFQKCQYLRNTDMLHPSYRQPSFTGQCATIEYLCLCLCSDPFSLYSLCPSAILQLHHDATLMSLSSINMA